jgi:hypothetical protein
MWRNRALVQENNGNAALQIPPIDSGRAQEPFQERPPGHTLKENYEFGPFGDIFSTSAVDPPIHPH